MGFLAEVVDEVVTCVVFRRAIGRSAMDKGCEGNCRPGGK